MAKSLLNNLLGRFGMDFTKFSTEIVDLKTYNEILLTRKVSSIKVITDNEILLRYNPDIDKLICEGYGINYSEALKESSIDLKIKSPSFNSVSVAISAATTAYGRIHINRIKNYYLKKKVIFITLILIVLLLILSCHQIWWTLKR